MLLDGWNVNKNMRQRQLASTSWSVNLIVVLHQYLNIIMILMSLLTRRGRVTVINANNDDQSTISVSTGTLEYLQLSHSDVVRIRGKNRKATVLVILADKDIDDRNTRMAAIV